jgi:hypothetical protein
MLPFFSRKEKKSFAAIRKIQRSLSPIKNFIFLSTIIFKILNLYAIKLEKKNPFCPWQYFCFQRTLLAVEFS